MLFTVTVNVHMLCNTPTSWTPPSWASPTSTGEEVPKAFVVRRHGTGLGQDLTQAAPRRGLGGPKLPVSKDPVAGWLRASNARMASRPWRGAPGVPPHSQVVEQCLDKFACTTLVRADYARWAAFDPARRRRVRRLTAHCGVDHVFLAMGERDGLSSKGWPVGDRQ
jgi:hypothetical protein